MIHLKYPAFKFPFVYRAFGQDLGICDVEMFLEHVERPTVVLKDRADNKSTSVTNAVEEIASLLYSVYLEDFSIDPQDIRWLQQTEDDWSLIEFDVYEEGKYKKPHWKHTEPFEFNWDSLRPEETYKSTRKLIDPFQVEEPQFHPRECHKAHYGVCSLSDEAIPDVGPGEYNYGYCRGLAEYAEIWAHFFKRYGNEDLNIKPIGYMADELSRILPNVDLDKLDTAIKLFGAQGNDTIDAFQKDDGVLELSNGRHRVCIARQLCILRGLQMKLGAIVEEKMGVKNNFSQPPHG